MPGAVKPETAVEPVFGLAIIVVAGLLISASQTPTPLASKFIDVVVQSNVVFAVAMLISVFALKLAASKICPIM